MKTPFIVIFLMLQSCISFQGQGKAPSHDLFTQLLRKHVTIDGKVDYNGFKKDSVSLNKYLDLLSTTPPNEKTWTKNDQMAYWINVYNAFTIKLITQYYPIASVKDIGSSIQIPFVNTPWDIKFIKIGSERLDLNNVEHGILRKKFDDPRIHMALVCASKSCPILLNEAYEGQKLDAQLDKQTKAFLSDPNRNKISPAKAQISMIFKWYGMDFNKNGGSVKSFINKYSAAKIKDDVSLEFLEYDWQLNKQ
jgi:hypothetical protein